MPSFGYCSIDRYQEPKRRPGVGEGKGRGVTKPLLRRGRRRRR